jgi:hypothetical protein
MQINAVLSDPTIFGARGKFATLPQREPMSQQNPVSDGEKAFLLFSD